jgi:hypothetical protein
LREHGLANADRSDEENVLVLAQEVEAEERLHVAPIDLDRRTPIESIEHHAVLEAGLLHVAFECLVIAALDLVGQQ